MNKLFMKLTKPYSLLEISTLLSCDFVGKENHVISGINEIHMVEIGDIVFVDHPKYYENALQSAATTIIIDKIVPCPPGKALLIMEQPFDGFNFLTNYFSPIEEPKEDNQAFIHPSAIIYPNVYIGNKVKIGKNCRIYSGVSLMDKTEIGENVIIGANTVIGHNAFYYKKKTVSYERMHTCGFVKIASDVEIGALCTIDAGVTGVTTIGKGTKIDNQVHIGHDTKVGENCLLAAGVGIAGCATIMNNVILWGQVGCASNIVVGEAAVVLAQSGIAKSLEGGKTYFGSPCSEAKEKFREMVALRQLPKFMNDL